MLIKKNHMILSVDIEKTLDKTQQSFIITTLSKFGIQRSILKIIKDIYKNSATNIVLNGEILDTFFKVSSKLFSELRLIICNIRKITYFTL